MLHSFGAFQRFTILLTLLGLIFLITAAGSFRKSQEKRRREDFGWSLEHLNEKPKNKAPEKQVDKKASPGAGDEIRLDASLAVFDVLVLNKEGKSITGFKKEDFIVTEDGKQQDVSVLTLGDGTAVPRSIILILDYSGSQFPYIKTSVEAAEVLVDSLGPKDKMAVVTDDVALLVDFTNNKTELKNALESLKLRSLHQEFGRSLQLSALMATLKELVNEDGQSAIIFQTDGDQVGSLKRSHGFPVIFPLITEFSIEDLYSAIEKSRVTIYSVIPGPQLIGIPGNKLGAEFRMIMEKEMLAIKETSPQEYKTWKTIADKTGDGVFKNFAKTRLNQHVALSSIAQLSGGWTEYLQTPDKAQSIYSRIFSTMNQRYIITYYPINTKRDGKLRKVKIEVRGHPEYVLLGRKSYYPPEN